VIFDCDGVLVDSETLSNQVLAEAITAAGWSMDGVQARQMFVGGTLAAVASAVEAKLGKRLPATWIEDYESLRNDAFRRELKAVPGVEDALESLLAHGVEMCVASQGRLEKIALSLRLTRLDRFFEGRMFSAYGVARAKPAPDLFLHAASSLGCPPETCLVVEDTVLGVKAAVAAGMPVLAFAAQSDPADLQAAGGQVFMDMAELPGLLGLA